MTPPDDPLGSERRGRQRALVGVMIILATVGVLVALPAADVPRFLRASGGHVGQGGVEDGQPAVDLGVGGGQRWGDAEGPAHPR